MLKPPTRYIHIYIYILWMCHRFTCPDAVIYSWCHRWFFVAGEVSRVVLFSWRCRGRQRVRGAGGCKLHMLQQLQWGLWILPEDVDMGQYLLIPFLGGWTSIYQLFWCSPGVQGFDTLPCLKGNCFGEVSSSWMEKTHRKTTILGMWQKYEDLGHVST